jgi:hypothetical protein
MSSECRSYRQRHRRQPFRFLREGHHEGLILKEDFYRYVALFRKADVLTRYVCIDLLGRN